MFEALLVAAFIATLIPLLYLLSRILILKDHIGRVFKTMHEYDEQVEALITTQRDLVDSFSVFDTLLSSLQYSRDVLSVTERSFICAFRERAAAYLERGCEGSLLSTHIREDRLKQLALELAKEYEGKLSRHMHAPLRLDALDNGEFSEYLKLVKYLVQSYLTRVEGVESDRAGTPRLAYGA